MQDNRTQIGYGMRTFWGTVGAFLWTMNAPLYDVGYALLVFGAFIGLLWLPWHRLRWIVDVLPLLSAVFGVYAAGKWLSQTVLDTVAPWSIWLWIFLIIFALYRLRYDTLVHSLWLPSLLSCVLLIGLFALTIPEWQLSNFAPPHLHHWWRFVIDVPVLLGGALTFTRSPSEHITAFRWGGIAAAVLWLTLPLTAIGCWSAATGTLLPNPVSSAWSRISVFSVFSHPELPALSLLGIASLWQAAAAAQKMITLYRTKLLVYNNKIKCPPEA